MKITILTDNHVMIGSVLLAEHGFSCYIELEDCSCKLLFDTGHTDVFLRNATKLGINLRDLTDVVISHGHLDHIWGLSSLIHHYREAASLKIPLKTPRFLGCPELFYPRRSKMLPEIGSMISQEEVARHFNVNLSQTPVWLHKQLVFLGRIPRVFDFECQSSIGEILVNQEYTPDSVLDDSALAYIGKDGVVVITGCSHSGICNIVEYAKQICGVKDVIAVIGGFHLDGLNQTLLDNTVEYLKTSGVASLYPCHCTSLESKIALSTVVNVKNSGVGLHLEF